PPRHDALPISTGGPGGKSAPGCPRGPHRGGPAVNAECGGIIAERTASYNTVPARDGNTPSTRMRGSDAGASRTIWSRPRLLHASDTSAHQRPGSDGEDDDARARTRRDP